MSNLSLFSLEMGIINLMPMVTPLGNSEYLPFRQLSSSLPHPLRKNIIKPDYFILFIYKI